MSTSADIHTLLAAARQAMAQLSVSTDPAAFEALLSLSQEIGGHLGVSARTLAEAGSWAQVADLAGTSRQAAWQRWSQPSTS